MQNPSHLSYLRLNVWGLTVGCAATTFLLGLISWPAHAIMWAHRASVYGMPGAPGYPMRHGTYFEVSHFGVWHLGLLAIVALWAGIGGAILAAVYNAVAARRG